MIPKICAGPVLRVEPSVWRQTAPSPLSYKRDQPDPAQILDQTEAQEELPPIKKRNRRHGLKPSNEPPQVDYKMKGMFILKNPNDPNPLPAGLNICGGFCCQGKECRNKQGECEHGEHPWKPDMVGTERVESVGDYFLRTGKGWFNKNSFCNFTLKPKYTKLLGDRDGPASM